MNATHFAMLLALCVVVACAPKIDPAELPPLPEVDVNGYLDSVATQLAEARAMVEQNPGDPNANGYLGMLYRVYRDFEAAEVALRRARLLAPGNPDWLYYHGEVLEHLADYAGALAAMRELLTAEDYAPARLRLGRMLVQTGQLDEASEVLQKLLDDRPDLVGAHVAYATVKERRGDLGGAATSLHKALALAGDFGRGHYALALVYRQLGREAEASKHMNFFETYRKVAAPANDPRLTELVKLSVSDKPVVRAAQRAKARGDDVRALALLEVAIERNPDNLETRAALVSGYAVSGQFGRAEAHYQQGAALKADHVELLHALGRLRLGQGRIGDAAAALADASARAPQNANVSAWLGRTDEARGNTIAAAASYRKALDSDPRNVTARRFYAQWLLAHAEPAIAVSELARLAAIPAADSMQMWTQLARAQAAEGNGAAALSSIDHAIDLANTLDEPALRRELGTLRARIANTSLEKKTP